jgi:hypothetical protein
MTYKKLESVAVSGIAATVALYFLGAFLGGPLAQLFRILRRVQSGRARGMTTQRYSRSSAHESRCVTIAERRPLKILSVHTQAPFRPPRADPYPPSSLRIGRGPLEHVARHVTAPEYARAERLTWQGKRLDT